MKKNKWLVLLIVIALLLSCVALVACDKDQQEKPNPDLPNQKDDDNDTDDSDLKTFEGIAFDDATFTYDGQTKKIEATNVPTNAKAVYENNEGVNAGVYNAKVTVTADGYKKFEKVAKLTIAKAKIVGLSMSDKTVTYNEQEHNITVEGSIPENEDCVYSGGEKNNAATNAGVYTIKAEVGGKNYEKITVTAKLTINKAEMGDFSFEDEKFDYDGKQHTIIVSGYLPKGEEVAYTGGENGENAATNVGEYTITAVIGGKNYVAKTLTAKLTIKGKEETLSMVKFGNKILFQNSLDKNRFYAYDESTKQIKKISNDIPTGFVSYSDKLFYLSDALLTKGISSFNGEKSQTLFSINGDNLTSDGTYLYYSVNNLLNKDKSGIFRVAIADLEDSSVDPIATKITSDKASDLVVINGKIYFANKNDGGKLYKVNASGTNQTSTLVYNYKVSDFTVDGSKLYFTRHITLSNFKPDAAIYSINLSVAPSGEINDNDARIKKISYSKGKYLTIVGDYLYFVNTDMLTSTIFGDGIYRAKKDGSEWKENVLGGTKMIDGKNDKLFSLATDGKNLYFYKANTRHLYRFDGTKTTDIMEGFVPPEEKTILTTYYAKNLVYNGELYFINMLDEGRLYKTNLSSGTTSRITSLEVADFAINDKKLYYSTVRLKVNFDLYMLDMSSGEESRISTEKCYYLNFVNGKIYYANFSKKNTINEMNFDGTNDTILFEEKSVDDYRVTANNGKLYFVAGGKMYVYDMSSKQSAILNKDMSPNEFIFNGSKIYFTQDKTKNYVSEYDPAGNKITNIDDMGMMFTARGYFIYNNNLYYYKHYFGATSGSGLYKIDLSDTSKKAEEVVSFGDKCRIGAVCVYQGKIYFTDAWLVQDKLPTDDSTGRIMCYDLTSGQMTIINA